ncbi:MAG: 4Fe-4S dicluster domain-containing protein [Candidatus Lokiarchaeota archaeon]|nr:4Fe-4S dicluster domain-containing protein [Candidatus Lokiarchaeota archaeon]
MTELEENKSCCDSSNIIEGFLKDLNLRISIDPSKCIACGLCEEICPFGLPQKENDGTYNITNPEKCTECSACERNCPTHAIIMQEQRGCGCLWDARKRSKEKNNSETCC